MLRSAVWLTIKESRASFAIEHVEDKSDRIQRFQRHGAARARLKRIVEGPDPALDQIIRSVRESHGIISGRLRAEYPILERPKIAKDVVRAIREEFPWEARF